MVRRALSVQRLKPVYRFALRFTLYALRAAEPRAAWLQLSRVGFIILLLSLTSQALALDPRKPIAQLVHDVWQKDDGLPLNSVGPIVQTPDGYLWIGTQEGLVRFDGVQFAVFRKGSTKAIQSNHITVLVVTDDGGLWIGTAGGGVVRLKEDVFASYMTRDGLSSNIVTSMAGDLDGNVWVGTGDGGLNCFKSGHGTAEPSPELLAHAIVTAICGSHDGALWAGTATGELFRLRKGRTESYQEKLGLPSGGIWALCEDRTGALWIGVQGAGLCRYGPGGLKVFTADEGLTSDAVKSICEDRDGAIWVATDGGGLNVLRDGRFIAYTASAGLGSDFVSSVYEDRDGSLWIGTAGGGLNRLRDGEFVTYGKREGLTSELVYSVLEDREGTVWVGTFGGGVNRIGEGRVTRLTARDGVQGNGPYSLYQDREGALWIGSNGAGLTRIMAGRFTTYRTREGLPHDTVRCIYEDSRGTLWTGTNGGGLAALKSGRFTTYGDREGLVGDIVTYLHEDREGRLWIGTAGGGLSRFEEGRFTHYNIPSDGVTCIHEDSDGILWISTTGGGLERLKRGKFTNYTTKDGLHSDLIFHILEDGKQNLWMTSNAGVFRVSKRALNDFAEGRASRILCTPYGKSDGLRDTECNGGYQPAGWKTRDGRLWFPTARGLSVVDPSRDRGSGICFPAVLEEALLNGHPVDLRSATSLPPGRRDLEFHYAAPTFLNPARVRFRYKLEGFDGQWIDAGSRRAAYYTNVPPGRYTFRVMRSDAEGNWNDIDFAFSFSMRPFFRETVWFYLLLSLLPVPAAYGLHRFRVRLITARAALLDERNRLAREIHDTVAQDLSGITLHLQAAKDRLDERAGDALFHLEVATQQTRICLDDVRRAVWALRPALLEGNDLAHALQLLASHLSAATPATIKFEIAGAPYQLPEQVEIDLLRATQESVSNAVKHGKATLILTRLTYDTGQTQLQIQDNGSGFDADSPPPSGNYGFGISAMRQRIEKQGGRVTIKSGRGVGTDVLIQIPTKGLKRRIQASLWRMRRAVITR